MPIKRYIANADNTISNAFEEDLSTRATGSNMGQADMLKQVPPPQSYREH